LAEVGGVGGERRARRIVARSERIKRHEDLEPWLKPHVYIHNMYCLLEVVCCVQVKPHVDEAVVH